MQWTPINLIGNTCLSRVKLMGCDHDMHWVVKVLQHMHHHICSIHMPCKQYLSTQKHVLITCELQWDLYTINYTIYQINATKPKQFVSKNPLKHQHSSLFIFKWNASASLKLEIISILISSLYFVNDQIIQCKGVQFKCASPELLQIL